MGGPAATAVATLIQSLTLIAGGIVSVPCILAAVRHHGPVRAHVRDRGSGHCSAPDGLGPSARHASALDRRMVRAAIQRAALHAEAFHDVAREAGVVPTTPLFALTVGRALQIVQFGVLAHAVGVDVTLSRALLAQGVNLVALALGVLVPGQIGATEGAFAVSAEALGASVAAAMSIALLSHALQVVGILVGSLTPLLWRLKSEAVWAPPVDARPVAPRD